ncbi:methyltransferase-like protein 7A [Oryzias latipes]|uniref:Methyltransferase type 11 domain-containing protein n=2 Tax=Oryzias latipes TaxID=8090 RepID=H2MXV6_ORYLA|nr:methyltransferase-like protein 7A [Oryzias latipes]
MRACFLRLCRLLVVVMTLPLSVMEMAGFCDVYHRRLFPLLAFTITFSYNDKVHRLKRELFRNMARFADSFGTLRLLEIGCGSGANFRFYPNGCTVTCTDPNPGFERYLRRNMDANKHVTYEGFLVVSGEDLRGIQDESVDVVVCTLVLCSVKNVQKVLQEAQRVLRKGGAFYFLEHVISDSSWWIYGCQYIFEPLWYYLGDGCKVTKATWKDLETAGFSELYIRHVDVLEVSQMIRPHIVGYSIK